MTINEPNAKKRLRECRDSVEKLSSKDLQKESALLTSKWHDYRFMSPWSATRLFGRLYNEQFKRALHQSVDIGLARNAVGIKAHHLESNHNGELTALWRARQDADMYGIRYENYLEFTFDFAMSRQRKKLPRPNQLSFTDKSMAPWAVGLGAFWSDRIQNLVVGPADLPQYRLEHYEGLPAQDALRAYIVELAREVPRPLGHFMREYAVERPRVPIRHFLKSRNRDVFKQQLRAVRDERRATPFQRDLAPSLTKDQLWQSCFGLPPARQPDVEPCSSCSQSMACQRAIEHVRSEVIAAHGAPDPVDAARRAGQARRTAASRARKKNALPRSGGGQIGHVPI